MTSRFKIRFILICLEVHERRKQQDHVAPFVHDGRVAEGTAHFARELVRDGFAGWVVPFEGVVAVSKVDVVFVEDGGPLEWGGWSVRLVWIDM